MATKQNRNVFSRKKNAKHACKQRYNDSSDVGPPRRPRLSIPVCLGRPSRGIWIYGMPAGRKDAGGHREGPVGQMHAGRCAGV